MSDPLSEATAPTAHNPDPTAERPRARATPILDPVRPAFRALAGAIVPEARELDDGGWAELEGIVEDALAKRPPGMRRQLGVFIRVLNWLPLVRWGRTFRALDPERRSRFLHGVHGTRVFLVRRGFWGLRTLVFMGYYARPEAYAGVGYAARLRGWLEHPDAPAAAREATATHAEEGGGTAPGHRAKPGGGPPTGHVPPPAPGEG